VPESQNQNTPVVVTGDERRHPAYRLLARACLLLAELRRQNPPAETTSKSEAAPPAADKEARDA
jgi:hypothetical protein